MSSVWSFSRTRNAASIVRRNVSSESSSFANFRSSTAVTVVPNRRILRRALASQSMCGGVWFGGSVGSSVDRGLLQL